MWLLFTFLYAIGIGAFNLLRKKMTEKYSPLVSLALAVTCGFLCISWRVGDAISIDTTYLWLLITKGIIIGLSWYFFVLAVKSIEVSKITLIGSLSLVISFICGILIFAENVVWFQFIGAFFVICGIVLVSWNKDKEKQKAELKPMIFAFLSAIIGAVSSLIDKYTLQYITVGQMQFWFMLSAMLTLWVVVLFVCIKQKKCIITKNDFKNFWAYLAGATLVCSDIFLFSAYTMQGSMLSVMAVISKLSFVITFFGGILFFHEEKKRSEEHTSE